MTCLSPLGILLTILWIQILLLEWLVGEMKLHLLLMDMSQSLLDRGVQNSNISAQLCQDLHLVVHPVGDILEMVGSGGSKIPYIQCF